MANTRRELQIENIVSTSKREREYEPEFSCDADMRDVMNHNIQKTPLARKQAAAKKKNREQSIARARARDSKTNKAPRRCKFSSRRYKIRNPRATTLKFDSGNQVIAGPKSSSLSLLAFHSFNKLLANLAGVRSTGAHSFRIQNMVSSCHFGYTIDLKKLAEEHSSEFSVSALALALIFEL